MGELAALNELVWADRQHEDWRFALVVCTLANVFRGKDATAIQPADVMPWLKPQQTPRRQTPEQMRKVIETVTRELGGIVHKRHVPLA
jgi:hypothetical protein